MLKSTCPEKENCLLQAGLKIIAGSYIGPFGKLAVCIIPSDPIGVLLALMLIGFMKYL